MSIYEPELLSNVEELEWYADNLPFEYGIYPVRFNHTERFIALPKNTTQTQREAKADFAIKRVFGQSVEFNLGEDVKDSYRQGKPYVAVLDEFNQDWAAIVDGVIGDEYKESFDLEGLRSELLDLEIIEVSDIDNSEYAYVPLNQAWLNAVFLKFDKTNITAGICGNCTWDISHEGKLTIAPIEGTDGKLAEWDSRTMDSRIDQFGWLEFAKEIKEVEIGVGVVFPEYCNSMFLNCDNMIHMSIGAYVETGNTRDMSAMFSGCEKLRFIDGIDSWDISSVVTFSEMFDSCKKLSELNLRNWYFDSAESTSLMFYDCESLKKVEFAKKALEAVRPIDAFEMFSGCSSLKEIDLSVEYPVYTSDTNEMFSGCSSLEYVDMSGWKPTAIASSGRMFSGADSLRGFKGDLFFISGQNPKEPSEIPSLEDILLAAQTGMPNGIDMGEITTDGPDI